MINSGRQGLTLIEMIVTIALFGILSAVATLAMRKDLVPDPGSLAVVTEKVRRQALLLGVTQTAIAFVDSVPANVTAFPDGTVFGDSAVAVNALTGVAVHASR
jgi:prepilin-type N-terminal cleavage/methylation domain-containing protein